MRNQIFALTVFLLAACTTQVRYVEVPAPPQRTAFDLPLCTNSDASDDGPGDASPEGQADAIDESNEASDALAETTADSSDSSPDASDASSCSGPLGTPGAWSLLTLPGLVSGNRCQSIVVDPVHPGTLVTACGQDNGATKIQWFASADYGTTWTLTNQTTMSGNPWGFTGDMNPNRDPAAKQTLFSPAGYGSYGGWISTDGAVTWTRNTALDTALHNFNPNGLTDLYETAILLDPNDTALHLFVTYHYAFKGVADGGFAESFDGGATWTVHAPPVGIGTSHYLVATDSAPVFVVVSQASNPAGTTGMWRTATAGRTGGTAPAYQDGTPAPSAWSKVATIEHDHGSYGPAKLGTAWLSPGRGPSDSSVWESTDLGATWTDLVPGYNWPSPPNAASMGKNVSGIAVTANYVYTNDFSTSTPQFARAPAATPTGANWVRNYVPNPSWGTTSTGAQPLGNAAVYDAATCEWVVFMTANASGIARFIEE